MKKIMFSDAFGLTQAVLDGRKTMTRRIIKGKWFYERCPEGMWTSDEIKAWEKECEQRLIDLSQTKEWKKAKEWALSHLADYKVGEVVAVAQSYKDCGYDPNMLQQTFVPKPTIFPDLDPHQPFQGWVDLPLKYHKGWNNKMFVINGLMPHQIEITGIRVERLQDISDADCLKEGVIKLSDSYRTTASDMFFHTAQEAFAVLIDKVSGKGTFERNPWVFAYSFELAK